MHNNIEIVYMYNVQVKSIKDVDNVFNLFDFSSNKNSIHFEFGFNFILNENIEIKNSIQFIPYKHTLRYELFYNYVNILLNNKSILISLLETASYCKDTYELYNNFKYNVLTESKIKNAIHMINKLKSNNESTINYDLVNTLLAHLLGECMNISSIRIYRDLLDQYYIITPIMSNIYYKELPPILQKLISNDPIIKTRIKKFSINSLNKI